MSSGRVCSRESTCGKTSFHIAVCGVVAAMVLLYAGALYSQGSKTVPPTDHGHVNADAESDLRTGIDLARSGKLEQAIPHLQAASGHVKNEYAAEFNLTLCYVGTGQFDAAIDALNRLRASGYNNAAMNNLLAQAYVGKKNPRAALDALHEAAAQTPKDEKLYTLIADACTDYKEYDLGLQVVNFGLAELPQSSRLHYERALFLARMDRFEEAKPEFSLAANLSPESDIAYLAMVQEALYEDKIADAVLLARRGIAAGHGDYILLTLLGTVLLHAGAVPGQPEFAEAKTSLEASVSQRPDYSTAQIALGNLYLMDNRLNDAVIHLEIGRRLEPQNAAVYPPLANAYRRLGERQKAQEMIAILRRLVQN